MNGSSEGITIKNRSRFGSNLTMWPVEYVKFDNVTCRIIVKSSHSTGHIAKFDVRTSENQWFWWFWLWFWWFWLILNREIVVLNREIAVSRRQATLPNSRRQATWSNFLGAGDSGFRNIPYSGTNFFLLASWRGPLMWNFAREFDEARARILRNALDVDISREIATRSYHMPASQPSKSSPGTLN